MFPFSSPCNDPFWCTAPCTNQLLRIGMNAISLSLVFSITSLLTPSNPNHWKSYMWSLNHHLLSNEKPQIIPIYWYSNKSLSHTIHLPTYHIPIILTTLQQLLVCSLNRYHTIVDHVDDITVHNRAQTMRHCHHRAPLILHALNAVKNVSWFSLSNALVASSRRRIVQNRSCQRQTLLLTSWHRLFHNTWLHILSSCPL